MIDVKQITELHKATVARWHEGEIDNPCEDFLELVCRQHEFNYRLWHQEDIARSRDVSDAELAQVKRNIDKFNQQRNDAIEQVDDAITSHHALVLPTLGENFGHSIWESIRLGRPVISVGNLAVGGTGKTACVELIASKLAARGRRVAAAVDRHGG